MDVKVLFDGFFNFHGFSERIFEKQRAITNEVRGRMLAAENERSVELPLSDSVEED